MKRSVFTPALAACFCSALVSAAFAQAQTAAPISPAPATRTKWVAPVKGVATVQVIKGATKRVGGDLVTPFKIKNMSSGSIALLRVDEYWYDNSQRPQMVTGDTQRHLKPINPGEIVEITTKSPYKAGAARSMVSFAHANGKIDAKEVKAFK